MSACSWPSALPAGVTRMTELSTVQQRLRLKNAYFALKNPTISFRASGDIPDLAQTIFEDLVPILKDVEVELRKHKLQTPQFSRLAQEFRSLMATSCDETVASNYFVYLTEFFHEERLAKMRNAVSSLAIYLDESTDLSSTAHGLLCATFFDEDLKFRDELIDIFDVSEEGAMVGASLEDKVYKILNTAKLVEYVDASFVDGASNVSDYPQRGYMHSYTALQKKHFAKLNTSAPCGQSPPSTKILITWWCLAHRFNLALGDVLKSAACKDASSS